MDGRFFPRAFLLEEFLLGLLEICKCPVDEEEFLLGLLEICKCPVDEYFSP